MAETESLGTDHALPFERARKSPADVSKRLSAALESDVADEPKGEDEPAVAPGDEPEETEPEGEPEDEEVEGEPEDESDEDEEPEEVEEPEEPAAETLFEVQGEKVTLQGLKDGWLRQADYTRKTQAVAAERRNAEAAANEARVQRDQYAERLQALGLALKELAPAEQDWDRLEREDPAKFNLEWARYQRHKAKVDATEAEQRRVYMERLADHERQQTAYLEDQKGKLHEAIPEWKDPVKEKAEKSKLAEYLTGTYGWTQEDLDTVQDHRLMVALRKSMLYDEGQKNGKAKIAGKIKQATKPLQPGARERTPRREARAEMQRDRKQLARRGGSENAAKVIRHLIPDL